MKKLIFYAAFYALLLLLLVFSIQRAFYLIKYYKMDDVSTGVISEIKASSGPGHTYLYYIIKSKDNIIYKHPDQLDVGVQIGDNVRFRLLHNDNLVRILTVNNEKINSYYYIADYFLISILFLIIIYIVYKIKHYK